MDKSTDLLKWYDDNRNLITVLDAETECGIPNGTLSKAIKGKRTLPDKYIQPLTVLMDSLTAGKPETGKPAKGKPSEDVPAKIVEQVAPMLKRPEKENVEQVKPAKGITRTETTASGLLVQYRDRYPTHNEKHAHNYTLIHSEGKGKPKTYFNGVCYMRTGENRLARFSFTLEDLN